MELVTEEIRKKLLDNWGKPSTGSKPVLKVFSPGGPATWLIHSMDPGENDRLYGLCDLGYGSPELGYVNLSELQETQVHLRAAPGVNPETSGLERDLYFEPQHTMEVYTQAARRAGKITEEREELEAAATAAAG